MLVLMTLNSTLTLKVFVRLVLLVLKRTRGEQAGRYTCLGLNGLKKITEQTPSCVTFPFKPQRTRTEKHSNPKQEVSKQRLPVTRQNVTDQNKQKTVSVLESWSTSVSSWIKSTCRGKQGHVLYQSYHVKTKSMSQRWFGRQSFTTRSRHYIQALNSNHILLGWTGFVTTLSRTACTIRVLISSNRTAGQSTQRENAPK